MLTQNVLRLMLLRQSEATRRIVEGSAEKISKFAYNEIPHTRFGMTKSHLYFHKFSHFARAE